MKQVFSLRLEEYRPSIIKKIPFPHWLQGNRALLICLLIFIYAGSGLQIFDPIAAPLDLGIITVLVFAILAVLVWLKLIQYLHETLWSLFKDFRNNHLSNRFKTLTAWQQLIIYFASFFGLSFLAALVSMAIF